MDKFFNIFKHWKRWSVLMIIISFLALLVYYRGAGYVACKMGGMDLDRPTDFGMITGNCMVVQQDGSKVYLKRLVGLGGTDADNADVDVDN